jgi:hypothetical protein
VTALPGPSMRDEEIPLPAEPPDEAWFETYGDDDFERIESDAEIESARLARWERARRVHGRPTSERFSTMDGPDPMGRHVGCDGDPEDETAKGCRAAPGYPCRTPGDRYVPGFVHPSRLAREYGLFGLDVPQVDPTTATV